MTDLIERADQLEHKLGVTFGALYAYGDGKWIHVNGELQPLRGDRLPDDLEILISFFDANGRMLGSIEHYVDPDGTIGFEPFAEMENLDEDQEKVTRIRVLAKRT
jgi:hypothetical protein